MGMATYAERILQVVSAAFRPIDDDEIAQRMGTVRQNVNQVCRRLESEGRIRRVTGPTGKIVNERNRWG
jgi:DNA-binding Lrp family transcriptional regulator